MAGSAWSKFPYDPKPYAYAGPALKKAWARLHAGDLEPFPEPQGLAALAGVKPSGPVPGFKGDWEDLALRLQDAWRAFHRGDFQEACEAGARLGPMGAQVANKAAAVYCTYLEEDDKRAVRLLTEAAARGEEACRKLPGSANAWYFHAFALGRYAQRISVLKALGEEIKVLDRTCNFLGVVNDDALPLSTPLGIALGADNRLYVVSHNANRLDVFNLEDVTSLQADPLAASFTVNYGVLEAAAQSIAMTNDGTTDLSWAAGRRRRAWRIAPASTWHSAMDSRYRCGCSGAPDDTFLTRPGKHL